MDVTRLPPPPQRLGSARSVAVVALSGRPTEPQHRRNMVLLDSDAFLTHFSRILEKSRGTGTVQITMKRCAPAAPLAAPPFAYPCQLP